MQTGAGLLLLLFGRPFKLAAKRCSLRRWRVVSAWPEDAWVGEVKGKLPRVLASLRLAGRGDRIICPSCGAEPKTRKCRVYPRNAPDRWTCEGCGEGGSALDAVAFRLGLNLDHSADAWAEVQAWCAAAQLCEHAPFWKGEPPRLRLLPKLAKPAPKSGNDAPRMDLDAGWEALRPFHRPDLAFAFWLARGVDPASAEVLARHPDALHLPAVRPAGLPKVAERLWASAQPARGGDPGRPMLFLVRDASGAPRGVQRRVLPGAPTKSKSKALPGDALPDDYDGRPHLLGCPHAAARALAAGETVALVEGEIDHACATAAGRVALGATSATALRRAAAALAAAWTGLARAGTGALDACGVVVTVAHRGDTPTKAHPEGAGGPCMAEAAEVLRAAGIPATAAVLPLRADGRADLGDVAEGRCGPRAERPDLSALDAVREVLASAPPAERAAGVVWAWTVDDARARVQPKLLREAIDVAQANRGCVVVVESPPGTGKTRAASPEAVDRAADGNLRALYATPTSDLARQAFRAAELARPGARIRLLAGLESEDAAGVPNCRALREAIDASPSDGETFRGALRNAGRKVCDGCPYRDECQLAARPKVEPGEVVFAPIALLPHLDVDLVVCDDCGKGLDGAAVSNAAVAALDGAAGVLDTEAPVFVRALVACGAAAWAAFNARREAAEVLRAAAVRLGKTPPPTPPDAELGHRITGADLAEVLAPATAGADAWKAAQPEARKSWPVPSIDVQRPLPHVRDREAVNVAALARQILTAGEGAAPAPEALALRLDDAGWSWEIRRPPPIPKVPANGLGPAVVALDGTASRTPLAWRASAAAAGRTLNLMSLRIAAAPRWIAQYTWRRGKGLNVGRLGARGPGGFTFATDAPGALRAALGDDAAALVKLRAHLGRPLRVGVVTHKPLALALRAGVEVLANEDRAAVVWNLAALGLSRLAGELAEALGDLEIGHFGADDRGTNRFDCVDAMVVLGCPRPPLASLAADAEAWGRYLGEPVDAAELRAEGIADTLAQCVARGRPLSNRRLALVAGCVDADAPDGPDLPGLVPEARTAATGDAAAWTRFRALVAWADLAEVARVLPANDATAEAMARALGWSCTDDREPGRRGRPLAFWAAPGDDLAAFRFRCLFKGLPFTKPQSGGGPTAPVPMEPEAPAEVAPCSPVGLAPINAKDHEGQGVSVCGGLELLLTRAHSGGGPPTAAALAELTGCLPRLALRSLAQVLTEAEAHAEITGADWPPPAWADTPPDPAPRPVEPAAELASKDLRTPAAQAAGLAPLPLRTAAAQPAAQPAEPAPVEPAPPAAFAPSHSQPEPAAFASFGSRAALPTVAAHCPPKAPPWSARYATLYAEPEPPAARPVASSWPGLPCPPAPPPMPASLVRWAAEELALAGVPAPDLAAEVAFQTGCNSTAAITAARMVAAFYAAAGLRKPSTPAAPAQAAAWPPPPTG
jgi:hypothetical protein